jgi:hypothetical protein
MIAYFVYNLEVLGNYEHLSVFYMFASMAADKHGPIISHERYFNGLKDHNKSDMGSDMYVNLSKFLEFDIKDDKDLQNIGQYIISQKLEDEMINSFTSRLDAWVYILKNSYEPLENCLRDYLNKIEEDYNEKIEAIICFYDIYSLRKLAIERNIPVIHYEQTTFRAPIYKKMGYFDFHDSHFYGELQERYNSFMKEAYKAVPLLQRKELLSILLTPEYMHYISLLDEAPQYQIGIGLMEHVQGVYIISGLTNSDEIILDASKIFANNEILTRGRNSEGNSFQFIIKCRRIAAVRSNMSFEAMLLGRTACVYGTSPYRFMGVDRITSIEEKSVPIEFLNFVVFGYYVPWKLLNDEKYIKWRLTSPSEYDIYVKHLNFWLESNYINSNILQINIDNRLFELLRIQGFDIWGRLIEEDYCNEQSFERVNLILNSKHLNQKQKLAYLEKDYLNLYNYVKNLKEETHILTIDKQVLTEEKQEFIKKNQDLIEEKQKIIEEKRVCEFDCLEIINTKNLLENQIIEINQKLTEEKQAFELEYFEILNKKKFLEKQIVEIEENYISSTSWKITKPLRQIVNLIRKIYSKLAG